MKCSELAALVESLQPESSIVNTARLCLLISNRGDDELELEQLRNPRALRAKWREVGLRLQAATDQHAAITEDIETLAKLDAATLDEEQIRTLFRAINLQRLMMSIYVGTAN